uniref:Serine/threonine-protein kinase haspin homolog n=1 Tax=Drosophila rhopaloa TaxID=1041015 RepID=A0A6P4EDY2_DRORH
MENTLEDNGWKDSFDKWLGPRPQLRNPNKSKKTVRASFNNESSVENSISSEEIMESNHKKNQDLNSEDSSIKMYNGSGSISTPCDKRLGKKLFNCGLSPITLIKLNGIGSSNVKYLHTHDAESQIMKRVRIEISSENVSDNLNEFTPDFAIERLTNKSDTIFEVVQPSIVLKPGKWRKSLSNCCRTKLSELNVSKLGETLKSRIVPHASQGRKSIFLKGFNKIDGNCELEVLKCCNQCKPLQFNNAYAQSKMFNSNKIGEGAYGEVFRYTANRKKNVKLHNDLVLKIIPIEGSIKINGEEQKTYSQILPEIIITQKMSSLQEGKNNCTDGFANIHKLQSL